MKEFLVPSIIFLAEVSCLQLLFWYFEQENKLLEKTKNFYAEFSILVDKEKAEKFAQAIKLIQEQMMQAVLIPDATNLKQETCASPYRSLLRLTNTENCQIKAGCRLLKRIYPECNFIYTLDNNKISCVLPDQGLQIQPATKFLLERWGWEFIDDKCFYKTSR